MSEILAYAAALFEECLNRSGDLRRFCVEAEILVDSSREIANRLQQRTSCGKRIARIGCQFRTGPDALRIENELVGVQDFIASLAFERLAALSPSAEIAEKSGGSTVCTSSSLLASTVRRSCGSSQREECQQHCRNNRCAWWNSAAREQWTIWLLLHRLPWKIAGRQTQDVMRDRDRVLVVVCGYVPDLINQVARSSSSA